MAGTFGHEVRNRLLSEKIFALSWRDMVRSRSEGEIVMAPGYSCRSQVKLIERSRLPHPVSVVAGIVDPAAEGRPSGSRDTSYLGVGPGSPGQGSSA
jgi:Fe-S oxidoreductase